VVSSGDRGGVVTVVIAMSGDMIDSGVVTVVTVVAVVT
jgi:hypothetical protein